MSSTNKVKVKENKGKQKSLPKLKAILANPSKKRCPILDEKEMEHLKVLLQNAIQKSELEPRHFATKAGICLGLESSLRKINNQTSSCVFISLNIKPNHIIGLIARNAETKDETQPVYAQPNLEKFIEELFGIQALCMVFAKDLLAVDVKVKEWVDKRKKPVKTRNSEVGIRKSSEKKKLGKLKISNPGERAPPKEKPEVEEMGKDWTGDFISFDKNMCSTDNLKLEDTKAVDALSEIIDKISKPTPMLKLEHKIESMEEDNNVVYTDSKDNMEESENSDNYDYFLGEYKTLTVHKIKGNPNKTTKKKRKKNKKIKLAK